MARYARSSHPLPKRRPPIIRGMLFITLFASVIAAFIYTVLIKKDPEREASLTGDKYAPIYAEDLGQSPDALKKKYPDLFLQKNRFGVLVGQNKMHDAQYTIWFVADSGKHKAFRLQAKKYHPDLKESDVLHDFADRFSRPVDSSCDGQTTFAKQKCHYKWWVRDKVSLDLYSRFHREGGLTLSTVTTDTYLSTKHYNQVRSVLPTR